jgi:signal peptidase I
MKLTGTHRRLTIRRSTTVGLLVTVAVVAAWLAFLRPTWLGGPAGYVIVAGVSMEPAFHTGDLAITQRQPSYAVGDVIAFETEGGVVIHRIVGGDAVAGYQVKGDSRELADVWQPRPDSIGGRVWFWVPQVGFMLGFVRQPAILAGLAAAIAFFLAFTAGPVGPGRRRQAPSAAAAAPLATGGSDPSP